MLHFDEAESLESKFQRLVDFTDALVGKQEESEKLRSEGNAHTPGREVGARTSSVVLYLVRKGRIGGTFRTGDKRARVAGSTTISTLDPDGDMV